MDIIDVVHFYRDNYRYRRLQPTSVFVFGSNLLGIHGAGSALDARKYFGARLGCGVGFTGRCYAIPTKIDPKTIRSIQDIRDSVELFKKAARHHPEKNFIVTPIGTGLSGYDHQEMAQLFLDLPINCAVTRTWVDYIPHVEKTDITDIV